jgi:hypothetical protein
MSLLHIMRAVDITTSNNVLRISEGGVEGDAVITPGRYFFRENGGAQSIQAALKSALQGATASTNVYSVLCDYFSSLTSTDPNYRMTISRTSGSDDFALLFGHANTTIPVYETFGWYPGDTSETSTAKSSDVSTDAVWISSDHFSREHPSFDGMAYGETPSRGGKMLGGTRSAPWRRTRFDLAFQHESFLWRVKNYDNEMKTWEAFWSKARNGNALLIGRISPPSPDLDSPIDFFYDDYVWTLDHETRERWEPQQHEPLPLWRFSVGLREFGTFGDV